MWSLVFFFYPKLNSNIQMKLQAEFYCKTYHEFTKARLLSVAQTVSHSNVTLKTTSNIIRRLKISLLLLFIAICWPSIALLADWTWPSCVTSTRPMSLQHVRAWSKPELQEELHSGVSCFGNVHYNQQCNHEEVLKPQIHMQAKQKEMKEDGETEKFF